MIQRMPAIVGIFILTSLASAESRTWTDRTGQHHIEAVMVGYEDGVVELQKTDDSLVKLPLNKLSPEDPQFVRRELRRRRDAGPSREELAGTPNLPHTLETAAGSGWSQSRGL